MADLQNAPDRTAVEPVWDQSIAGRDERPLQGPSGDRGVISGNGVMYAAIASVAFATAIVNGLSAAQDAARHGLSPEVGRLLFWELSSVAVILLAVPILVVAVRRIRLAGSLASRAASAVMAFGLFSAVHIAGIVWLRKLLLWLAGASYDFGFSVATVVYEVRKDLVTAFVIGGTIWLFESRHALRERARALPSVPPSPAAAEDPGTIWLRDGTSRIRVEPDQILWISSAGNYIEYRLADGTTHLIRGTLAAAEAQFGRLGLVRIHRTRLANLARVVGIDLKSSGDFELAFDNGQALGGSRRYRSAVAGLGTPPAD
jgi:hypothetical protein